MHKDLDFYEKHFKGVFEHELLLEMEKHGRYQEIEAGHYLMKAGGYIKSVPIILDGTIKILREDNNGKEMLLYHLSGLDSCAMSLTCCLSSKISDISALAEENTKLLVFPFEKVEEWMCKFNSWKIFVFQTYQKRFDSLLETIDCIAFNKLDQRLLSLIKKKIKVTGGTKILYCTHEELATELATSREVVSRLLKQLEKIEKLKLSRNKIELL
ncbi:MAG TPA: Crp/Fnr family transcriptional regulator [Leadbetterella sp.]|nr:Crp/Fnr family transcriptional regulator [Leadbetterella sp.]